jgi:Ca-activated chloride channel family protein
MKMMLYTSLLVLSVLWTGSLSGQTSLQGKVTDADSGEPIMLANVVLFQNGVFITGGESDFDGNYRIYPLDPGTYDVEVSYVGYETRRMEGVLVKAEQVNVLDVELSEGIALDEVVVTSYKIPLIEKDNTTSGAVITTDQIRSLPAGVQGKNKKRSQKQGAQIKGSRSNAQVYYLDGVRISGNNPQVSSGQPNTESYQHQEENTFHSPLDEPLSTFSIDVDRASYSNVRRFVQGGNLPPADAVRIEELINYFDYDYPLPKGRHPFSVHTELGPCPWNPTHQLLHIGLQGREYEHEELPPSNLVFLLDVSGSMGAENKLPLVKQSIQILVGQLRPEDRVAIVVYAGAAGLVLPSTPASEKETILTALGRLESGGSTAGGDGIKLAYKVAKENFLTEGNNRVILATDGDFNVGISGEGPLARLIEKKRDDGIYLTVLGFGMGNYKDSYLEVLADKGNGNYAYIDSKREAQKVFAEELTGTLFTIAKDVKLQLEFNPRAVEAYRLIGYENRLLAKEDFNDDTKDAGELGAGHTVTAIYEIIPAGTKTELTGDVDPLRYQRSVALTNDATELLLLKLRYKHPDKIKSTLLQKAIQNQPTERLSENYYFSAALAAWGMKLRKSEYIEEMNWKDVFVLAEKGKGADRYGYRQECIALMNTSGELMQARESLGLETRQPQND